MKSKSQTDILTQEEDHDTEVRSHWNLVGTEGDPATKDTSVTSENSRPEIRQKGVVDKSTRYPRN